MAATDVISVGLLDFKGKTGTYTQHIPSGSTDAQITAYINAVLEYLDNITGCQITGCQVTKSFPITGALGLKVAPTDGLDFEKGANIGFDVENSDYRYTIRVPAIDEALVVGEEVNYDAGAVGVWATVVTTGIDPVFPSNKDGLDLLAPISGLVTFHKSKK